MARLFSIHALILFAALLETGCSSTGESTTPSVEDITLSVYASAVVRPENEYTVYSQIAGVIETIPVKEGDTIKRGDTLAILKAEKQNLQLQNAQLQQRLAEESLKGDASELKAIQEELEATKIQLNIDSLNLRRQQKLWEKNIGSRAQLEQRQLLYQSSQAKLTALKQRYAKVKLQLTTQLEQSINSTQISSESLQDFVLISKRDGMVYTIDKEIGELIVPQEPLAMVGSATHFIIELQVDEVDIAKVKTGQKAILSLDAYPDTTFVAHIQRILPNKNQRTQTFTVEAGFEQLPARLYSGISGEANVIVGRKTNAITVPTEYLTTTNKVLTDDGEVEITIGERTLSKVEVLSGIDSSTVIYLPD